MLFNTKNTINLEGNFTFSNNVNAIAHPCLNKDVIKDFWKNFTFQSSELTISESSELIFSIGNAKPLSLDGCDYSINIEEGGICVCAENENDLIRGFMTLIDRFYAIDGDKGLAVEVKCCQIKGKPVVQNRMVHFCIFPDTELWELKRFVRFCGALKYTHVVLEFWGMLQYDCMKELSWSHGFTKEQIKPIIKEANDLGLEIIPMFNHWGHASASRAGHGKHVVLDQNPSLQTYFSDDGWCWNIAKPKVKELLRKIRDELCELCGSGSYFHIGCDEAYGFKFTKEDMDMICDYINGIADEMRSKNRRVIAWGDMFLYRHPHYNPNNGYSCNAPSPEAERYMIERLSKDLIIADWQYNVNQAPVETAEVFARAGFDCLLCPWDRGVPQMNSVISTVSEQSLMGFMHTTWHTLTSGTLYVVIAAAEGFDGIGGCTLRETLREARGNAAALLRKVMRAEGDYEKSGWARRQINNMF